MSKLARTMSRFNPECPCTGGMEMWDAVVSVAAVADRCHVTSTISVIDHVHACEEAITMQQSALEMRNQTLIDRGNASVATTYGRTPIALIRGEGMRVWDADGKMYYDFLAGLGVNNLGHCHPKVLRPSASRPVPSCMCPICTTFNPRSNWPTCWHRCRSPIAASSAIAARSRARRLSSWPQILPRSLR